MELSTSMNFEKILECIRALSGKEPTQESISHVLGCFDNATKSDHAKTLPGYSELVDKFLLKKLSEYQEKPDEKQYLINTETIGSGPSNENALDTNSISVVFSDEELECTDDELMRLRASLEKRLGRTLPRLDNERWADYADRVETCATRDANAILSQRNAQSPSQQQTKQPQTTQQHQPQQQQTQPPQQQTQQQPPSKKISYAQLAVNFPNLPTQHNKHVPYNTTHTEPPKNTHDDEYSKGIATNYSPHRVKTTTCEPWYAGYCQYTDDECWFLHDTDELDYPINWVPRNGYYTSRKGAHWRHREDVDGSWVHEHLDGVDSNGVQIWVRKTYDEYAYIMKESQKR